MPEAKVDQRHKHLVLSGRRGAGEAVLPVSTHLLEAGHAFVSLCLASLLPPKHVLTSGAGILTGPDLFFI